MNGDPQKRKVLYEALTKDGYDLGTYEEYSAKLDDPAKVRALYDGIKGKYDVGDFEVFSAKVGPSFQQPLQPTTTPAFGAERYYMAMDSVWKSCRTQLVAMQ